MAYAHDVVIIGSGPNGLAAACVLARAGLSVQVVEGHAEIGGGTRTRELTLPGFQHDVCSSVHPIGRLSPVFRSFPLEEHGLTWIYPPVSAAHPLDDGPAALLCRSYEETGATLGEDAQAWRTLIDPFARDPDTMFADLLAPLRWPRAPFTMLRFGLKGLRSARTLARASFRGERARALFGGCAAHAVLPLDAWFTGAVGLLFAITGRVTDWPVARGGSHAITKALASYARSLGATLCTDVMVRDLRQLAAARAYVFDTSPKVLLSVTGDALPSGYRRRLSRFYYGPAVFKIDWALAGPIPWKDPAVARASTVHVGGTLDEMAHSEALVWRGEHPERPFVMVSQQSHFDDTRAPRGKHTGHVYCHVPGGSTRDMRGAIIAQIERFAPGFRDLILAEHVITPADLEAMNPNNTGGAITGGAAHWAQLFTRPVARLDPYRTPHPQIYLCSGSTPPGGGVHGMGGYWAAQSVLRKLGIVLR